MDARKNRESCGESKYHKMEVRDCDIKAIYLRGQYALRNTRNAANSLLATNMKGLQSSDGILV